MERNQITLPFFSIALGIVLTLISAELFEVECGLAEPGGVNEGGKGFPIYYYNCGVWGESLNWPIAVLDVIILSFAAYLILKLIIRQFNRH